MSTLSIAAALSQGLAELLGRRARPAPAARRAPGRGELAGQPLGHPPLPAAAWPRARDSGGRWRAGQPAAAGPSSCTARSCWLSPSTAPAQLATLLLRRRQPLRRLAGLMLQLVQLADLPAQPVFLLVELGPPRGRARR